MPSVDPIHVVPDWVCEILSPATRRYDLVTKRPFYARVGVEYLWYIDVEMRSLTVSRLSDGRWLEVGVHVDNAKVRAPPFEAIEIDLGDWWS